MSFSSEIKEELSKTNSLSNKQLVSAEFIGYLISNNTAVLKNKIKYATESEYNINRFSKLLSSLNILDYQIEIQGKTFAIIFNKKDADQLVKIENDDIYIYELKDNEEETRALVRGAFLGAGSMNNPQNTYHLEISISNKSNSNLLANKLNDMGIKIKILENKNSCDLYLKDGEEISKFLAFIGANSAVLKFEEARVVKEMNNKVNRLVNCETANLNKTINASVIQIEAIEYLKEVNEFEKLENNLKEIAEVRLKYPDAALSELGKFLKDPIGKSGVNYRLKKIIEIADDLKNTK